MESLQYEVYRIPKSKRGFRVIYAPNDAYKKLLKSFLPTLDEIAYGLDVNGLSHAFVCNRNCATNASQHIGYNYTITVDLQDFFDCVNLKHLQGKVPDKILDYCLIDGAPRQGLPTSPILANIALSDLDNKINDSLKSLLDSVSYSRYADDFTVSYNEKSATKNILYLLRSLISGYSLEINESKTRVQSSANGRRIITGIGVDHEGIHATRKVKKMLRAAIHQENKKSARGLFEWALCKLPNKQEISKNTLKTAIKREANISCRSCGKTGLLWHKKYNKTYVLWDPRNGRIHRCPEYHGLDGVKIKLLDLGFEKFVLEDKALDSDNDSFFMSSDSQTIFIAFRKGGVNIFVYESNSMPGSDTSIFIEKDKAWASLDYKTTAQNIHRFILYLSLKIKNENSVSDYEQELSSFSQEENSED